jgi:Heparinase II/III-like protein/Heparinase II/III N-terminus
MSFASILSRAHRIIRKRPGYVLERVTREVHCELDRWIAPPRQRRLGRARLLALSTASSIDELWQRLRNRPFPAITVPVTAAALEQIEPGESERVRVAAEQACRRIVKVLGMDPVALGSPIDWSRDYRVGLGWDPGFARAIDYVNRDRPSDVKIPWEISRLQWLIPVGQAYLLTGDNRYATVVRDVIDEWITGNPLAYSVNWACTMEAAMRLFTWTWFFHVFAGNISWGDETFRVRFLSMLYLHGDFTLRHIEKADINGNHYIADLAGLVFAGLFFGKVGDAERWAQLGWAGLVKELQKQVFADGVDYEASCAYHRLVFELFMWAALYRRSLGFDIPPDYEQRLRLMARFSAIYTRADGSSPLWGDADDARTLPFGGQPLGDHRYMAGLAAIAFGDSELASWLDPSRSELLWTFGPERVAKFPAVSPKPPPSAAFREGGCYIMRDGATHIFIDCGPIGLAGRGGHGHNDALSFEAWLDGAPLLIDCGSYVYTASFEQRNRFRSTNSHNTPMVDQEEINRFDPNDLWNLHDDARPVCLQDRDDETEYLFTGMHHGYERLGIEIRRTIRFDKRARSLEVHDRVNGTGRHAIAIPFHLAPGVSVRTGAPGLQLNSADRTFEVTGTGNGWSLEVEPCLVSPSYGVALNSQRLAWKRVGNLPADLRVLIRPAREPER